MDAVRFLGQSAIRVDRVEVPLPEGREVVIKIKAASICGTDRENLEGKGQPTVPGHENAGEVVAVDRPAWVSVGTRVAINCHVTCRHCAHCLNGDLYFCPELRVIGFDRDGGYADYLRVPEQCCMPLPQDISYEVGSLLVDMLGTPYRAVKRAGLLPGAQIAIWGAGPIGLGALLVAVALGSRAAVLDFSESRLQMARELGAELALNPRREDVSEVLAGWTDRRGLEAAFDCVGHEQAVRQGMAALKKRGTQVIVGVSHRLELNPWEDFICRELTVYGSRNFNLAEFDEMIALVRHGLPVGKVITHRFKITEAERAFSVFRSGECGKILFVE